MVGAGALTMAGSRYISADAAKTDPRLAGLTTCSQLSCLSRSDPRGKNLTALVDTVLRDGMPPGSLLSAWSWEAMATIMFWFAVSALAAAVLLVLAGALLVPATASRLGLSRIVHLPARPAPG